MGVLATVSAHAKGFDQYGYIDTDTYMVIPIYTKPILPPKIYIKAIPIQISVLKFQIKPISIIGIYIY